MKNYFKNSDTGLVRSGWRILIFFVILISISAGTMIGVRTILGGLRKDSILIFVILAFSATTAVLVVRRYLDKRSFSSLGLRLDRFAALDIAAGILNSAIVMATAFFTFLYLGLIEFKGLTWWGDGTSTTGLQLAAVPIILGVLFRLAVVAWWEELAFRGYLFQNLINGIGLKWAVVVSSFVFGLIHATNPNATILSTVVIVLITPQLIYAYLKSGQLWLPMGIHLGWNFFQASVFGFAASGQDSPSMIAQTPVGPEWLSGGSFGAEGSVLILPITAASLLLIHFWVKASRHRGQKPLGIAAESALESIAPITREPAYPQAPEGSSLAAG